VGTSFLIGWKRIACWRGDGQLKQEGSERGLQERYKFREFQDINDKQLNENTFLMKYLTPGVTLTYLMVDVIYWH
jgi:hypothetical protein